MVLRHDSEILSRNRAGVDPRRPGGGSPHRAGNARVRPVRVHHRLARGGRRYAGVAPRWLYRGYVGANAGDLAAAIAFNALIALVPSFLMLVSIAGLFLRREDVLDTAIYASFWALPPQDARDALAALLKARRNSGWFGVASLVGFLWVGVNFVGCLARSMNRVYGVRNHPFVHQRVRAFLVVVAFAALFSAAAVAATVPTLFVRQRLGYYFETWVLASWRGQVVSYLIAFGAALLLFLVLYRAVPNANQRLRDVWPGTLTAALLFMLTVQAFPLYLRLAQGINRVESTFGFVSLLVVWFYVLAHILLFGTYVNATYQRHCHRKAGPDVGPMPERLRRVA